MKSYFLNATPHANVKPLFDPINFDFPQIVFIKLYKESVRNILYIIIILSNAKEKNGKIKIYQ